MSVHALTCLVLSGAIMEFLIKNFQSDDLGSFLLIAFCLVASAFFSASETAITSINASESQNLDENW